MFYFYSKVLRKNEKKKVNARSFIYIYISTGVRERSLIRAT